MKIWLLMSEEPDSYDVGMHLEIVDAFAGREEAEAVADMLDGKPKKQEPGGYVWAWSTWNRRDMEIVEQPVRMLA